MMSKQIYVVEHRKDRSGWLVILACAALLVFWKLILIMCFFAAGIWLGMKAKHIMDERRAKQISRNAALALRADHENQLAIMGDPMGVYGRYTPPTMPITAPHGVYEMRNGIMFDDWNDGLEHWK